jgi:hypothetical protein
MLTRFSCDVWRQQWVLRPPPEDELVAVRALGGSLRKAAKEAEKGEDPDYHGKVITVSTATFRPAGGQGRGGGAGGGWWSL